MNLLKQLAQKKAPIVEKWFDLAIHSYSTDAARLFQNNKDPFTNPVGHTTRQTLETVFDVLVGSSDRAAAEASLTQLIRIRAVQAFTPAQALRFIFDLKAIIRSAAGPAHAQEEMAEVERRIDDIALIAFDIYMQCREKIYDLKANEVRSRTFKAFARAGLIKEPPESVQG